MKFLVTGGAGYIGSITVRHLLDRGHEVVVLDTLERGFAAAVDSRALLVVGNVGDEAVLDQVLPGCDAVMHLAGYIEVAESQADPGRYFQNNTSRPLVMLEAMVRHEIPAIVFSSSAAVYGEPEAVPIPEEAATRPVNAYGASKLMFEQLLDWYGRLHGIRSIRFRYFNAAGAWPDGSLGEAHDPETHILPRILRAIASDGARFRVYGRDYPTPDGTCVRDYIHVIDLAQAHRLGLERLVSGGQGGVYNLGSGHGFSNLEVVNACAEVTEMQVETVVGPRRPGDPAVLIALSDKARNELGWRPERIRLEQMVADAWKWHTDHPKGFSS